MGQRKEEEKTKEYSFTFFGCNNHQIFLSGGYWFTKLYVMSPYKYEYLYLLPFQAENYHTKKDSEEERHVFGTMIVMFGHPSTYLYNVA